MAETDGPVVPGEQLGNAHAQMEALNSKYSTDHRMKRRNGGNEKQDHSSSKFVGIKHALPWNKFNRQVPEAIPLPAISKPSKEESQRRKQWREEKIKFQERQQRLKEQR